MAASKIEWTDRSDWNPIRGCTRVSPGCGGPGPHGGCYAEAIAARFSDPGRAFHGYAERTASGPRWTGKVEIQLGRLDLPLRWKKPAKIFVSSTSDLFHEKLSDSDIDRVFAVMALAPQHVFQVLTKRAERMREYLTEHAAGGRHVWEAGRSIEMPRGEDKPSPGWPLPNVWLGVSVEDQPRADERIPHLLATPAAVRFLSCEPLLGPIDLEQITILDGRGRIDALNGEVSVYSNIVSDYAQRPGSIDWVIAGGESGPHARPFDIAWPRSLIAQCRDAGVPCFVKQLGAKPYWSEDATASLPLKSKKGGDWSEWPDDLRVREFPT